MKKRKHQDYGYSAEIWTWFGVEGSCFSSLLCSGSSFFLRVAVPCMLAIVPNHSTLFMNIVTGYA
jgi:hypothetical protein